jgi:hypothetical protein
MVIKVGYAQPEAALEQRKAIGSLPTIRHRTEIAGSLNKSMEDADRLLRQQLQRR